jgi:hypothetical protein
MRISDLAGFTLAKAAIALPRIGTQWLTLSRRRLLVNSSSTDVRFAGELLNTANW